MATLEYHVDPRGTPGYTVTYVGTLQNYRMVIPAHALVDSAGNELGTAGNPLVTSGGGAGGGTSTTATAAAPAQVEGSTNNALSTNLTGDLRVISKQSGAWSFSLTGTLPAFAATPTFNMGTTNGIALDATLTTMSAKLPAALGAQAAAASFSIVPATGASFAVTAAALPLPAGASTEATLAAFSTQTHADLIAATPAGSNLIGHVDGPVASGGANANNPIKTGGVFNTTLPTVTNGQIVDLQLTARGRIPPEVTQTGPGDGQSNANIGGFPAGGLSAVPLWAAVSKYNGTSWDRDRKPNGKSRIASTAASGSPTVAKASAGDAGTFWGQNAAAITYLQFYDQTSTPVIGTSAIVLTFPIPANAAFSAPPGFVGTYWATGLAYAFTTDAAGTTAAAAAAVTSFALTYA